ncbi:MAG: YjbF family lipoprotein [Paracoccaceae bacterium]|nr:YjbF family lipoprotein [Paracoccaceae bacterium]
MRAHTVSLMAALALAACSSSGSNDFQRIGALAKAQLAPAEPQAPAPELTRAELDQIPWATIALSFGDGPRSYLVPLADNGGYLTYLDSAGHGLVMFGGAVTGTQAFGKDLEGVLRDPRDPIAHPVPLADWPGRIDRQYQFAVRDNGAYAVTLACVFDRVAAETVEIVELDFDLVRIAETCTNARRQVVNTYWVEAGTGFIWKSVQWLGPDLDQVTIEIIRPYGG